MSALWLYGVAAEPPPAPLGAGLAGEAIEAVACGRLVALAGEIAERPPLSRESLAAHDATVRRLAALSTALLPARFGESAPDEAALCRALEPRSARLAEALALVEGAVQMTLRVFGDRDSAGSAAAGLVEPAKAPAASPTEAAPGPGARYLDGRRRLLAERRALPEVAALREALRPLLRAERVERHAAGHLLATAYDLVPRGEVAAYEEIVRREAATLAPYRVVASGPWPPYAFAPDVAP